MHVIVIGAGIVGVCNAWYLRSEGFDVTVIERRSGVAQEASHGIAGAIGPGCTAPWAAPGVPGRFLARLFQPESPAQLRGTLSPALWSWLARWLGECRVERHRANRMRIQRLASHSLACLRELRVSAGIDHEGSQGCLQLLRGPRDLELTAAARAILDETGAPYRMLSPDECRTLEPGLSQRTALTAGILFPDDEAGNCAQFAQALRRCAESAGVRFRFGTSATRLHIEQGRIAAVGSGTDTLPADAVVVAAGVDSARLLAPAGVRVPILPVKGHSANVTLDPAAFGPRHALIDEAYKTTIVRFGNRLRIAGTADFGDRTATLRPTALRTLLKVAADWFPGAARYSDAQFWTGIRPMLPDGPPLLGRSRVEGLYLNVGHGAAGWALACGSGKLVADLIAGREPDIPLDGLTLERYR